MVANLASPTREALVDMNPLPSWNDTGPRKAIMAFVTKVTKDDSAEFVPPAERVAVFDNDGTLWCEQPMPVQLFFVLDRVKALAPQHPEWKTQEPFASVLKGIWVRRWRVASARSLNSRRARTPA